MPCALQLLCATATPAVHGCARTRCRRHDAMQGVKNQRDVSIRRRRSALVVGGGESALWQKTGVAATLVAPEVAAQRTITSESAFAKNSGGGAISRASSHADLNHLPTCRPRGAQITIKRAAAKAVASADGASTVTPLAPDRRTR